MYYERPGLEKGSKKYVCPKCGQKKFKRYIYWGQYIDDTVGICDRRDNCGYHKPPKEWFTEHPTIKGQEAQIYQKQKPIMHVNKEEENKEIGYVPGRYILDSAQTQVHNLMYFLLDLFDWEALKQRTEVYFLGCTNDEATIFPQIDEQGRCRTAKIQGYDKSTGKRIKGSTKWVHAELKYRNVLLQDFNLKMCLFGLHLINSPRNTGKTICICESEKSALIAACCLPQNVWMAAGALNYLNVDKLKSLRGWNIVLYPDTSINGEAFKVWSKVAERAKDMGLNVTVSDMLEKTCTDEQKAMGYDLGDYLIDTIRKFRQSSQNQPDEAIAQPERDSKELTEMKNKNPALNKLIDCFGLVEVSA